MKTPEERRELNNEKLRGRGIALLESLPVIEESTEAGLRSFDEICERAVATLLSTQVACDINEGNYPESVSFFLKKLDEFGVSFKLNPVEKRVFNGTYSEQDAVDVSWEYEAYWALVWALGLVENIENGGEPCDVYTAIQLVGDCENMEQFKANCKLRDTDELLDMLDLYYRYHWATTEKRINPETEVGGLDDEIVMERRRGLEWLFSRENNWFDIELNT
ncbi:MAG: DUF4272 domain-containing protein [Oscillospiraceae bacterium]|nr:DUF4272 domain-containing protein [Oscillospiraceae bacterium]